MNFPANKNPKYADYVLYAKSIMAEKQIGVNEACRLVADEAIRKNYVLEQKREVFLLSLRRTYFRGEKAKSEGQIHGNCSLTAGEEAVLIGLIKGFVRAGELFRRTEIVDLANQVYPGRKFGDRWYPVSVFIRQ